ncbi:hypothetical protein LJC45_05795, partial [Alistipes sp. OttesenSCG-928-B03]|nr:hypothetical protein [Alistipes sp. OttesenSCG-928-B03]
INYLTRKFNKPPFHPLILENIVDFADYYSVVYKDSIDIKETCFPLICTNTDMRRDIIGADTVIYITMYRNAWDWDSLGYKGIIQLDSINVAIFDKNNVGVKYYNSFIIEKVPLDTYYCLDVKIESSVIFTQKNGILEGWDLWGEK